MVINPRMSLSPGDAVSDRRLRVARLVDSGMRMAVMIGRNVVIPESKIGSGR